MPVLSDAAGGVEGRSMVEGYWTVEAEEPLRQRYALPPPEKSRGGD